MFFLASVPTLTGLSHARCTGTGPLTACPIVGTNVLTIAGSNFHGPIATITTNVGCQAGTFAINGAFTQITCTLAVGSVGFTTADLVVTTNGGDTAVNTGFKITYGKVCYLPCITTCTTFVATGATLLVVFLIAIVGVCIFRFVL